MINPSPAARRLPAVLASLTLAACGVGSDATLDNLDPSQAGDAAAELRAGTPNIILEQASIERAGRGGASQFSGSVLVKRLAYSKKVNVVFTTDGWATTRTLPASYQSSFQGDYERWTFFEPAQGGQAFEFAVSYEAAGTTSWDNNDGSNYSVSERSNNVPPLCAITFASAAPNGDLEVQVKLRDLAFTKSVAVSFELDHQRDQVASARFEKKLSPGIELWTLRTRFADGPASQWPRFSSQATCSMLGMNLGPSWTGAAFPGATGTRE